jgi:hypothetical protein
MFESLANAGRMAGSAMETLSNSLPINMAKKRKNKQAMMVMHHKAIKNRRHRRKLYGRS